MKFRTKSAIWVLAASLFSVSGTAFAADADIGDVDGGDQIVVTGSRGERLVVEQAQTVTQLGGDQLQILGLNKLSEITAFAPGLFQPQSGITPSHITIFIRGIGELDQQGRPSVGVYVDDVFIPRTTGSNLDLLDVQSVDVARGPQGFTFGHSAEGGTISIRTRVPDNSFTLNSELGYGSFNEFKAAAAVSGPIVKDLLYFSAAGQYRRRDGITRNVTLNKDANNLDIGTFRAKLRLTPSERLSITAAVDGTVDHGDAKLWNDLARSTDPDIAYTNIDTRNVYKQIGVSGIIDYALSDDFNLKSITAYRTFDNNSDFDNTGDLYARGIGLLRYDENFRSQEVRLNGTLGSVDIVAGGYLSREEWTRQGTNNGTSTLTVDPNLSSFQPIYARTKQVSKNAALFGQASWHATSKLSLIGGLRWNVNKEHNDSRNWSLGPTSGYRVTGYLLDQQILYANRYLDLNKVTANWTVDTSKKWSKVTPKAAIEYQWTSGFLTYVSYSQGRKDGGFDHRGIAPTAAAQLQNTLPYAPELLTTWEAGFRATLLGGKLKLNAAAFYNDFDDIQLTTLDPVTLISRRFSAGDGHIGGFEAEAQIQPTKDLTITLSGGYLDATLDKFKGTPTKVSFPSGLTLNTSPYSGARLPDAPEFQGHVSLNYRLPLPGDGDWRIGGSAQYRSSSYVDPNNNAVNKVPEQTLVNLNASYTTPDGRWTFRVDGRNVFNKRYAQWKSYTQSGGTLLYYGAFFNDPGTVYASIRLAL